MLSILRPSMLMRCLILLWRRLTFPHLVDRYAMPAREAKDIAFVCLAPALCDEVAYEAGLWVEELCNPLQLNATELGHLLRTK